MSTRLSKRELFGRGAPSAGLGLGALALTRTQTALADTPFTSFPFQATGASTPRTLPDRLTDIINVKDYGALGDGSTDDTLAIQNALNAAYGSPTAPHGGTAPGYYANRPVFFPAGNYIITSPLQLRSVMGGHIFGAGRVTTTIVNTASNGSVFVTNGCEFSRFERLQLISNGTGVCFDLNWDGTGTAACQSNTFSDMSFNQGAYGLRIGYNGYMGSETLIANCYFQSLTVAGIYTGNYNACQQTILGGNFSQCATAIYNMYGSTPLIAHVGFQGSGQDILIYNSANDSYHIAGCRTESAVFLSVLPDPVRVVVSGCYQVTSTAGFFVDTGLGTHQNQRLILDGCYSLAGSIRGNSPQQLYMRGCVFGNPNYLSSYYTTPVQII